MLYSNITKKVVLYFAISKKKKKKKIVNVYMITFVLS